MEELLVNLVGRPAVIAAQSDNPFTKGGLEALIVLAVVVVGSLVVLALKWRRHD